jgi:hypothetical protein
MRNFSEFVFWGDVERYVEVDGLCGDRDSDEEDLFP